MINEKKRVTIPIETAAKALFLSDRTCCVCRELGKSVQLHHINENTKKNDINNLAVLCFDCHRETQISGGFARKLNSEQIILYRGDWLQIVSQKRTINEKFANDCTAKEGAHISDNKFPLIKTWQVPNLPSYYLSRPEELTRLKAAVFADMKKPVVVMGISHRLGVQGMGGIGKSVIAAALAWDEEIRQAFIDVVFWITLGQRPSLTMQQSQLANRLSDEYHTFKDVEEGKAFLNRLIFNMNCLLILDDVWHAEHAEAFSILGPKSQLLITTRDAGLLVRELGAKRYKLDELNDEQALELLAKYAGYEVKQLPITAREIIKECGNLPLALAMIGAMVRDKAADRWDNTLHKLRAAELDKIQQKLSHYTYDNLSRAIKVSIEELGPDIQKCYYDFAIFPEDTPIPEAVLQTFWNLRGLDKFESQDVIDLLIDRALVCRDDNGYLELHDLQYDYVRNQTSDLSILHKRLLDAYTRLFGSGWHNGPNDGYYFQYLAYHLFHAEQKEDLKELLLNFRWLQAKLDATDINPLISDYDFLPNDPDMQNPKCY